MKRNIDEKLMAWAKSERRKPLIVRGARQVGKTFSLMQLGRAQFKNTVVLNLEKYPNYHAVFQKNLDPKRILAEIELLSQSNLVPGETLLFIDEIQACPQAIAALRYFYEEYPDLHVVATGSLLEFALGQISFPVGRVQFLGMNPLNFCEFLTATGQETLASTLVKIAEGDFANLSPVIHQHLLDELRKYFFVGGMPEAVKTFVARNSFRECFEVHAEIINAYRQDFSKYRPQIDERVLEAVLNAVARTVGKQIIYTKLGTGVSHPTLKKAFDLLTKACLITKIESTPHAQPPLGASLSKRFKAVMLDIGLMHHLCGLAVDVEYTKDNILDVYEGRMAEQFVGQELRTLFGTELFYWSRSAKSSSAEVDFLISQQGLSYPIEVKSGTSGRLRSLHYFLEKNLQTPYGLVLSGSPPSILQERRLRFLPLYTAGNLLPHLQAEN